MNRRNGVHIFVILLMFLTACGGGGDGGGSGSTGTVSMNLADASTTDYQAVYITIQEVAVHKDGGGWEVISTPNRTYNLLDLVNGVREEIALATLASGHYTQMRLVLTGTPDDSLNILSRRHPYGNYFIDSEGGATELNVPSAFQTGIKVVKGFDISANGTTELLLDFDAARSIVKAGSSAQWLLKPTIKMLSTTEYSIVEGNAGKAGVLVSAQAYDSSAAAEEDKVGIQAATVSDGSGNYKLFLEPGSYTLVGYKDGYAPYYMGTKVVTTAGSTTDVEDFSLVSASSTGTLTGGVVISGADSDQYATISIRQGATVSGNLEQIEVKSINVANGGDFTTALPTGSYTAVASTSGRTAAAQTSAISSNSITNIDIAF